MTDNIKLPPLPEKVVISTHLPTGVSIYGYTADQMQAYASEAVKLNARGSRATTHAAVCWSWGPKHYECAVGQIGSDYALLRQALEALESADWYIGQLEWLVYSPDDTETHEERAKVQSAIAALRERLGERDIKD